MKGVIVVPASVWVTIWIIVGVLLIAVALFGSLAVFAAIDRIVTGRHMQALTTVKLHPEANMGTLIVYLPGILTDGHTSCQPIIRTLRKYGDVATVAYDGDLFRSESFVAIVADWLNRQTATHSKIILVGSSMGGVLALDLRPKLQYDDVSVIFGDSPSGASVMKAGGNIGAPLMRALPFAQWSNKLGAGDVGAAKEQEHRERCRQGRSQAKCACLHGSLVAVDLA